MSATTAIKNQPLADGQSQLKAGFAAAVLSLFASSSTLVCCALPALLVALGAGAALSGLVSVFPQLVWLSEHKLALFGFAGLALAASGMLQWHNRFAPCPADPALRSACLRTRHLSVWMWALSVLVYAVGGYFAFLAPWLAEL
jgi:hypothetical protein